MSAQDQQQPVTDQNPRCWRCGKFIGRVLTRPWAVTCPRCNALNKRELDSPDEIEQSARLSRP